MPLRLDSQSPDFAARFRAFLAVKREAAQDVETSVRQIIDEVKAYGDRSLFAADAEIRPPRSGQGRHAREPR